MQSILENMESCVGCSACAQRCPALCVSMVPDDEGFLFPLIDEKRCTDCGLCKKACPVLNAGSTEPDPEQSGFPRAWAAWCLDDGIRLSSSSGGLFSMFAESCLRKGGMVFGAAFDSDFTVRHTGISGITDLDSLRRSKYVQSDINMCYRETEKLLKEQRPVLFSGTGCQIAGLKSFLGKQYPGLLTIDVACYGVPSPKVWSMYLDDMKKRYKSDISAISFRDKRNGWKDSRMHISFRNGRDYCRTLGKDPFFIGFGKNLLSRKCCFNCQFRHPGTRADLTLADFWGAEKIMGIDPGDNKGISLVIANTSRGEAALTAIREKCFIAEAPFDEAVSWNPRLTASADIPLNRPLFFADMNRGMRFPALKRKYMNPVVQSIKLWVKRTLGEGVAGKLKKLIRV